MKTWKINSLVLGSMSLTFGLLKFMDPFKTWYATQITTSGLPSVAYPAGIAGEIFVGLALLLPFLFKLSTSSARTTLMTAHGALGIMMLVACYVHLIPEVPAEVLPLKIKPPFIPLAVFIYAIINLLLTMKSTRQILSHERNS